MDIKYDKGRKLDLNHNEGQPLDKKESLLLQNGIVNLGFITNGFCSKLTPYNDDIGSECGYTSKKRKARRNSIKNTEPRDEEQAMLQDNQTQEPEAFGPQSTDKRASLSLESFQDTPKVDSYTAVRWAGASEVSMIEHMRKNSESKTAGPFVKKPQERAKAKLVTAKEDSWTLFKPPPVFPVDNSSAKIVPKISYASKVKENLKIVAQAAADALPPQVRVRLSQVPMSSMKTITSANVTNGPVPGDQTSPSVGTFFASVSSSNVPASSLPCGENVASFSDSNCISKSNSTAAVFEPRNCSILIYPLNMQPMLQSACQVDYLAAQTNQNILGEIIRNEWGLSFINEPSLDPEGAVRELIGGEKAAAVTFQGGHTALGAQPYRDLCPLVPEPLLFTLAQDSEKITCATIAAPNSCAHDKAICEKDANVYAPSQEKRESSAMSNPSQEKIVKPTMALSTYLLFSSSKENGPSEELKRGWGTFDLKAAVTYHTKEMEHVFDLQKQDPNRVVFYGETTDGPDQSEGKC